MFISYGMLLRLLHDSYYFLCIQIWQRDLIYHVHKDAIFLIYDSILHFGEPDYFDFSCPTNEISWYFYGELTLLTVSKDYFCGFKNMKNEENCNKLGQNSAILS